MCAPPQSRLLHPLEQNVRLAALGADAGFDVEDLADHRIGNGLARTSIGGDHAFAQNDDAVGEADGKVEIVQDGNHGGTCTRPAFRGFHQIDLMPQVETGRRLIEQEQIVKQKRG